MSTKTEERTEVMGRQKRR